MMLDDFRENQDLFLIDSNGVVFRVLIEGQTFFLHTVSRSSSLDWLDWATLFRWEGNSFFFSLPQTLILLSLVFVYYDRGGAFPY